MIALSLHSGLSFRTEHNKSMSVGIMFIYFNKIKLKLCEKKAGLEPETDLFQATIMGTGKSIDFYIFV